MATRAACLIERSLLRENGVVFVTLPAHTSHVLQPLYYWVFGPLKEEFKRLLIWRIATLNKDERKDVFNFCDILCSAYHNCLTPRNVISGFRGTGIWNNEIHDVDPGKVRLESFTSSEVRPECLQGVLTTRSITAIMESSDNPHMRKVTMERLCELFKQKSSQLASDGVITGNGTVKVSTRTWGTMTGENVLSTLRENHERRTQEAEQRVQAQESCGATTSV